MFWWPQEGYLGVVALPVPTPTRQQSKTGGEILHNNQRCCLGPTTVSPDNAGEMRRFYHCWEIDKNITKIPWAHLWIWATVFWSPQRPGGQYPLAGTSPAGGRRRRRSPPSPAPAPRAAPGPGRRRRPGGPSSGATTDWGQHRSGCSAPASGLRRRLRWGGRCHWEHWSHSAASSFGIPGWPLVYLHSGLTIFAGFLVLLTGQSGESGPEYLHI